MIDGLPEPLRVADSSPGCHRAAPAATLGNGTCPAAGRTGEPPVRAPRQSVPWPPASGPIPERTGDHDPDRDGHRAKHRDPAPAEMGQQCRGCGRCDQGAGCGEHDIEARRGGAVRRRRHFDDERQAGRHRRGEAEADDEAQRREEGPVALWNEADRSGADAADEGADDELALAAPGIGHAAPGTAPAIAPTPPL